MTRCAPLLTALVLVLVFPAAATAGELRGRVMDKDSGDELIGVDIIVVGTGIRGSSDIEGRFSFRDLTAGTYELRFTYLGYNARFVGDLQVRQDGVLDVDVHLQSFQAHDGGELVVQSSRVMSTETALLAERQQSSVIGDGISASQIARSPDGTSGEALKRVTGLTVDDGKYVIIRGMPDRYNVTTLDGIPVTGTDIARDRKSFSFDMVPSNLLANLTALKSVTPDMPGDVTGGLVRVNTMEFPEHATTKIGFSAAHITENTGEDFHQDAMTGSTDWLGIDDGGRDKPEVEGKNDLARALTNRWTPTTKKAPPKLSFNLAHGNRTRVFGKDLGYMAALSYRSKYEASFVSEHRQGFEDILGEGPKSVRNILWGGIGNLFLRLSDEHRLGWSNTYTRSADSTYESQLGYDSDTEFEWTNFIWQERYQFVSRVTGKHILDPLVRGLDVDWGIYYGESAADEPDNRFINYNSPETTPTMSFNRRSWSELDEYKRGASVDLSYSFAEFDFEEQYAVKLKGGFLTERRERAYDMDNWYSDTTFNPVSRTLRLLPMEEIFDPENYNEEDDDRRGPGFNFKNEAHFSGDYNATHDMDALYGMVDIPLSLFQEDLRIVGGIRYEDSDQTVLSVLLPAGDYADSASVIEADVLPSINLTYNYDVNLNLRLAYYKSLNRPEFRELAGVLRRNYSSYQNEMGNPDLKRAVINNYDVRAEFFPRSGELVAASYFYKELTDPIEEMLIPTAEGPLLTWTNSPEGKNHGYELELRKRLDFLSLTRLFALGVNYTRIWSEVEYYDSYSGDNATRPLQGQAPWLINFNLMYDHARWGLTGNLLFSKIGRRLDKVGNGSHTDIYLEPRDRLDLVFTKRFLTRFKAKFAVKNMLDSDEVKTSGGEDVYEFSRVSEGVEYALSLSIKF